MHKEHGRSGGIDAVIKRQELEIEGIPGILWGEKGDGLFIAIHGDESHKADTVIEMLAEEADAKGCRTLSIDLPEHGGRRDEPRLCNPQNCTQDLRKVLAYAQALAPRVSLFGCSVGAYFGMLAYRSVSFRQALFLSPVVDMRHLIEDMMGWFGVSAQQLEAERVVPTSGKTLYWDYYQYTVAHPIAWNQPTALLYGGRDSLCPRETVKSFTHNSGAEMTVLEEGEHYFSTNAQLAFYRQWLRRHIL